MRLTDGTKTVEITIARWNGGGYDPDWSDDYFGAGNLPHDDEKDAYIVDDVDYCIDMANACGEDGACSKYDEETGTYVRDEDMTVFVTEL